MPNNRENPWAFNLPEIEHNPIPQVNVVEQMRVWEERAIARAEIADRVRPVRINPFGNLRAAGEALGVYYEDKNIQGEDIFKQALSAVREIYEVDGMIAGGAVRDTKLGLRYKDVDIFLPLSLKTFGERAAELGWQLGGPIAAGQYVKGKERTERYSAALRGNQLDVILLGEDYKEDPISKFPCFFTRCRYSLDEGYHFTRECEKDLADKTVTISKDEPMEKREVWASRFEDWTQRNKLTDWKLIFEGEDPNWWAEKVIKKNKKGKVPINVAEYIERWQKDMER